MEQGSMLLSDVKNHSMQRPSPAAPHDQGPTNPVGVGGIGAEEAMEFLTGVKRNQHAHPLKTQ